MSMHHTLIWNLAYHEVKLVNCTMQGLRVAPCILKAYKLKFLITTHYYNQDKMRSNSLEVKLKYLLPTWFLKNCYHMWMKKATENWYSMRRGKHDFWLFCMKIWGDLHYSYQPTKKQTHHKSLVNVCLVERRVHWFNSAKGLEGILSGIIGQICRDQQHTRLSVIFIVS